MQQFATTSSFFGLSVDKNYTIWMIRCTKKAFYSFPFRSFIWVSSRDIRCFTIFLYLFFKNLFQRVNHLQSIQHDKNTAIHRQSRIIWVPFQLNTHIFMYHDHNNILVYFKCNGNEYSGQKRTQNCIRLIKIRGCAIIVYRIWNNGIITLPREKQNWKTIIFKRLARHLYETRFCSNITLVENFLPESLKNVSRTFIRNTQYTMNYSRLFDRYDTKKKQTKHSVLLSTSIIIISFCVHLSLSFCRSIRFWCITVIHAGKS